MTIAYIAHPIGGDVQGNLEKIKGIVRKINLEEPDVVPFVPYFADCVSMNDNVPDERKRGIKNDTAILKSGVVDEVRLYGDRISKGMWAETELAHELGIRVFPMTASTTVEYHTGKGVININTEQIFKTLSLLSSIIEGGENHSSHSRKMLETARVNLETIDRVLEENL